MPNRICGKCFNTVHMWFNFRQMCYNSQVFLTTQTLEVADIDQELEDLQIIRTKFHKKTQDVVECLEAENVEDVDFQSNDYDDHYLDDDVYEHDIHKDNANNDMDIEKVKIENMDEFISDNGDLLEALTTDDYDEAISYINAEDDVQLEEFIDHCATKNVSIRQLNARALIKYKPKITRPPKKNYKDQKLPKPSTYMCNVCGNVYSKKPLFQHHMRMHSDVKPYQCE